MAQVAEANQQWQTDSMASMASLHLQRCPLRLLASCQDQESEPPCSPFLHTAHYPFHECQEEGVNEKEPAVGSMLACCSQQYVHPITLSKLGSQKLAAEC